MKNNFGKNKSFIYSLASLAIFCLFITVFLCGCNPKSGKTIIKFSSWGSESEITAIQPILKEFEKQNPDIKVEFIHIPKNYFQKLHLLAASNLMPDVVLINNLSGSSYAENNIFLDLSKLLNQKTDNKPCNEECLREKDFFKQSIDALKYKDKLYAVPRDISNLVVYYNKDIFDKYNVPYPDNSWTFEKFLKISRKLTKDLNKDGKTDQFGVSFEESPLFWLPWLWSNSGGLISKDLKSIIINKPESIEALQFYSDLRNKYHSAPTKSEAGSATMAQLFIQKKLAMHISGRWSTPRYRKDLDFRWDIARFPNGKAGSIVDCDASGWAISSSSKHPQESWRLIKFLASKTSVENFAANGLIVPARIDAANSKVFLNKNLPPKSSEVFINIIPDSMPTPVTENYQEITDILNIALEPVWNGQKSANEVINSNLTEKLNQKLVQYRK